MKNQDKTKEQLINELEKLQNRHVTEKRLLEEVLRESDERILLAIEGTDDGIWDWDVKSGEIVLNDHWKHILDYDPKEAEFDFKWWEKSVHQEDFPVFEQALNAYLEGREKYYELEYRIKTKSGVWKWIWARGVCVAYDDEGKPLRLIGTHRDITERKRAEEALRESEAELRKHCDKLEELLEGRTAEKEKLIDYLRERVKELDCLYHLSEYRTLPDIPLEEMLNKVVSILPQAWQYPEVTCARITFGNKVFETKNFARTKWLQSADIRIDGELVGVVEVCYLKEEPELDEGPFLNEERKLINTVAERLGKAIRHDELERHQRLSTQILELLNRSSEMSNQIRDILLAIKRFFGFEAVGIRLRKGEDFPYYEVSGFNADFIAAERYLCAKNERGELSRDSEGNAILECMCGNVICGRTDPSRCFFTEGGSFWTNSTTRFLATTTEKDRGARARNRCNSQGYESLALIPLRSGKESIGLLQLNDSRPNMFRPEMIHNYEKIGASIGIALQQEKAASELDRAHRQVEARASALESANSELSQYGYVVSHDLRAPLRAIRNYAEFLHVDLAESLTGEQKDYLDGMLDACREADALVEDLLSFSQIDRQKGPDKLIDIGEIIRDILKTLKLSNDTQIVLENNWPVIKTSRVLLQQIFQNLIVNAVKFNVSRPKRVELGFRPAEDNAYEFIVRDNGIGIDRRYHEKIFRVFERLHTSKEYEGTGIGLAIVNKSAAKLHGSVRVESDPGRGSTFFITIPCGEKAKIDE